jgi:uncharacterized protein DUF929
MTHSPPTDSPARGEDGAAGVTSQARALLLADLDAIMGTPVPPSRLHTAPPQASPAQRPPAKRWRRGRFGPFVLLAATLVLVSGVAFAAEAITNLGKPTSATSNSPIFPLSGFHRIGTSLHAFARPELLFISAVGDESSAVERWALVKALDQFGTLSNVGTSSVAAPHESYASGAIPTFDLTSATYRSRYLNFVHKDVLDSSNHLYQSLDQTEKQLYDRYARSAFPADKNDTDNFRATLGGIDGNSQHAFPLIAVGGYLQTASNVLYPSDFFLKEYNSKTGSATSFASFDAVRQSLGTGKPASGIQTSLITDVNAEANTMIALICHADHLQPGRVCNRSVIKQILKHVR